MKRTAQCSVRFILPKGKGFLRDPGLSKPWTVSPPLTSALFPGPCPGSGRPQALVVSKPVSKSDTPGTGWNR